MPDSSSIDVPDVPVCSLCLEIITQPKVLPCSHTFCVKCLQDHMDKSQPTDEPLCPQCDEKCSMPPGELSVLPLELPCITANEMTKKMPLEDLNKIGITKASDTRAMADSSSIDVPDVPVCSLCLELPAQPKVLSCSHTFCVKCLQDHIDKSEPFDKLLCPHRNEKCFMPPEELSVLPLELPCNTANETAEKLHLEDVNKIDKKIICDLCAEEEDRENGSLAEQFCYECDQHLCQMCASWHKKMKASKSHRLVPLADKLNLPSSSKKSMDPKFCTKHQTEALRVFCRPCENLACLVCMVTEHKGHPCTEVTELASTFREKFQMNVTELRTSFNALQEKYKELKFNQKYTMEDAGSRREKILERYEDMMSKVDQFQGQLLTDLNIFKEEETTSLKSTFEALYYHEKLMQFKLLSLSNMISKDSDLDVVFGHERLIDDTEVLLVECAVMIHVRSETVHYKFASSSGDCITSSRFGEIIIGEKVIMAVGLQDGKSVKKLTCRISLDTSDKVDVIDSTPATMNPESAACVISNTLYAVGIGSAANELWKWSPDSDAWKKCANLPSSVCRHCVTVSDDKLYVLGGWENTENKILNSVVYYEPSSDTWTVSGKLVHAVMNAVCMTYEELIVIFGGNAQDAKGDHMMQIYNTTDHESFVSRTSMPFACSNMRIVRWDSQTFLLSENACYIFNFYSGTWQERPGFKSPVSYFGLTIDDHNLYITGGVKINIGPTNELTTSYSDEVLSLPIWDLISDKENSECKHHATLPFPALIHSYSATPILM